MTQARDSLAGCSIAQHVVLQCVLLSAAFLLIVPQQGSSESELEASEEAPIQLGA